ncbi:MAG: alpha/beta hydrolase [Sandaracinus sp.]|nr:alpha/beta hydrolase [Sandaracinus sp.]
MAVRLYGHEIALRTLGPEDGPPVLFLHSSGMSGRQWRGYARDAAERGYRVHLPDYIGCGGSEPWRGGGSFHFLADLRAMDELIRRIGQPVGLVGHSYGAFLAIQLATTLRESIAALVVYEPVAWGVLYEQAEGDAFHQEQLDLGFFDDANGGSESWMKAFVEWWSGPGAWEAIGPNGRAQMMKSGRKTFEEVRSLGEDQTPALHYATITAPTLVMNGARSPIYARQAAERLTEVIPGAARQEIDAGHLAPMNAAALVAPPLHEWLERHHPPQAA